MSQCRTAPNKGRQEGPESLPMFFRNVLGPNVCGKELVPPPFLSVRYEFTQASDTKLLEVFAAHPLGNEYGAWICPFQHSLNGTVGRPTPDSVYVSFLLRPALPECVGGIHGNAMISIVGRLLLVRSCFHFAHLSLKPPSAEHCVKRRAGKEKDLLVRFNALFSGAVTPPRSLVP